MSVKPGKRYLHMRVNPGKAFLDNLVEAEVKETAPSVIVLHVQFMQQRFHSKAVLSTVEPHFNESFVLCLQDEEDGFPMLSMDALLELNVPIYLSLVKEDQYGSLELLACHTLEWRKVLVHGKLSVPVELRAPDKESKPVPVGLLDIDFQVLPLRLPDNPQELPVFLEQSLVVKQLNREKAVHMGVDRRFHAYAKAWWQDYIEIRPQHHNRLIKMFATGEDGRSHFVCTYVQPLRGLRSIASPFHAARFVRLLPFQKDLKVGGGRTEVWYSPHTVLSKRAGDMEDHATLLCSLLLGFDLDAWVCVGTTHQQQPHVWVITRSKEEGAASSENGSTSEGKVVFWESLTGQRFPASASSSKTFPFVSVHCIFNHKQYFANNQEDDLVCSCSWDVDDRRVWKPMNAQAIAVLPRRSPIVLLPYTFSPAQEEERLIQRLKELFSTWRTAEQQLSTTFDDHFAYILSPALEAYEMERLTGRYHGNSEFEQSVKNHIPAQFVFKGVPFQFNHCKSNAMFKTMLQNEAFLDVLKSRGDEIKFAVQAKVVPYAEDIMGVWVMLGVKYRQSS